MPKRILIVDDEPEFAALVRYRLQDDRYEFEYAPRGLDALNKLALIRPDAVLLDVQLPDVNGVEVCEILNRRSESQRLPIILVSGLSNTETRTAGQRAGACGFLTKPVDFRQLKLLLENALTDSASEIQPAEDLIAVCG